MVNLEFIVFGEHNHMNIAQINLGLLPIPPNGWGAVEKIIWDYKIFLERKGHTVAIPYINEISAGQYDIVHVHAWNHALELHERGIPYIYTCHDHHTVLWGKDSQLYRDNLRAMELAEIAIVPARYLVEYFNNVPYYLPHGIDTVLYSPSIAVETNKPRLLCVGNNGLANDINFDRKGFRFAIEAARQLQLPITVVGPTKNNRDFFNTNSDLIANTNIIYDATDDTLRGIYAENDILIHASSIEAGHPPLTLLEAAACGLPIISTDCAGDLFTHQANRDADDIASKINEISKMYKLFRSKTLSSVKRFDWAFVTEDLASLYEQSKTTGMKKSALKVYNNVTKKKIENNIIINFIDGPTVEITGQDKKDYHVQFIDGDTDAVVYETDIATNHWAKCSRKWFTNWIIRVTTAGAPVFEHRFDCKNSRVFIAFESSSLGDTLAWFPYVDEFRKKNNCKVIVSTFLNSLFKSKYPDLEFVEPGSTVHNLYAMYRLGCFYDDNGVDFSRHKTDYRKLRLQELASDILGLPFTEIRPRIQVPSTPAKIAGDYVTIGIHSTAQLKYWNNKTGWQDTVDYLTSKGIQTVHISKQSGEYMGNVPPTGVIDKTGDFPLAERITDIANSKMFIGISSGLSWVAWALGVPTIIISGCTEAVHEPSSNVYRIINTKVCNSCFSDQYFNKGDWNWCPKLKTSTREFECSKEIPFSMVKPSIDKILGM